MDTRPKTIFCDIDGTLVEHNKPYDCVQPTTDLNLLPGTLEKFEEWDRKGYLIILVSGRRESAREITEKQLREIGIFYDKLILGCGGGPRVLINDKKSDGRETAFAINLERNCGIENVDI